MQDNGGSSAAVRSNIDPGVFSEFQQQSFTDVDQADAALWWGGIFGIVSVMGRIFRQCAYRTDLFVDLS